MINRHTKNFFLLIIIFIIFSCTSFLVPQQTEVEKTVVEKVVKEEINKQIAVNKTAQFINQFFDSIFSKIKIKKEIIRIIYLFLIFLLCTLIVLIIIFIVLRVFSVKNFSSQRITVISQEHRNQVFDEKYLSDLIDHKQYSEAIVYLHRCTVFDLIKQNIIFNKNMTNLAMLLNIKDLQQRDAFTKIYQQAEKILFDAYNADENDLLVCQTIYLETFNIRMP